MMWLMTVLCIGRACTFGRLKTSVATALQLLHRYRN